MMMDWDMDDEEHMWWAMYMCIMKEYGKLPQETQDNLDEDDAAVLALTCMAHGVNFMMVDFQNMVAFGLEMMAYIMREYMGDSIPMLDNWFPSGLPW